MSDSRSRGRKFDPGPVPYFSWDWSFRWFTKGYVTFKRKYVHEVLVNCLVKLAQENSVVKWTDGPDMTIAVDWDLKHQTKTNKQRPEK